MSWLRGLLRAEAWTTLVCWALAGVITAIVVISVRDV